MLRLRVSAEPLFVCAERRSAAKICAVRLRLRIPVIVSKYGTVLQRAEGKIQGKEKK